MMTFLAERTRVILGGPGAGKTRALIGVVEAELRAGVPPGEIAFVAFTKAAAEEAKRRAALLFNLNPRTDLPWFRTIHSLAYQGLGITKGEVMGPKDWENFGAAIGEVITASSVTLDPTERSGRRRQGDMMLGLVDYAATTLQSLDAARDETGVKVDRWELRRFAASLENYKEQNGKMSFTDLLLRYPENSAPPPVRVAVIDEAQDLTRAQWRLVEWAFADVERVYIGGDDDQAIYRWAGADVDYFLALQGAQTILPASYRLPQPVFDLGQRIVSRIARRFEKPYAPAAHAGEVRRIGWMSEARVAETEGSWMLLARNAYMLRRLASYCEAEGVPYRSVGGVSSVNPDHFAAIATWELLQDGGQSDAEALRKVAVALGEPRPALRETTLYAKEDFPAWPWTEKWDDAFRGLALRTRTYYAEVRRRGEDVTNPRAYVGTIHSVKGAEADNVLLVTDVSARTMDHINSDHEHRVFYVGVTRAARTLYLLQPQTTRAYSI